MGSRRKALLVLVALLLGLASGSPAMSGEAPKPDAWEEARMSFRAAGELISKGRYADAKGYLDYCREWLPAPYGKMAAAFKKRLTKLVGTGSVPADYRLKGRMAALCLDMGDYPGALKLALETRKLSLRDPQRYTRYVAWCYLETGDARKARAEYRRGTVPREQADKHLKLAAGYAASPRDRRAVVKFVEEHYIKARGDHLGALDALSRVLPYTWGREARLGLYRRVFKSLSALGDEGGLFAWEERLLADFGKEPAARAGVHLARGRRAHRKRRYDRAIAESRKALAEKAEGDKPADSLRNHWHEAARLISECYEAKRDYRLACDYALAARDKYKPAAKSGALARMAAGSLEKRIGKLKELLRETKKPGGRRL